MVTEELLNTLNRGYYLDRIFIGLPILVLIIFLFYPVVGAVIGPLLTADPSSIIQIWASAMTYRIFSFTVLQAVLSTMLTLILGLPGAFILARTAFRGKSLIRAAIIVPFVLPSIAVVVGFMRMFGAYGLIDSLIMSVTGSSESVFNLASGLTGIVLAHALYNIPIVILMVSASLERLSPEIEESAEILGATALQRLIRIIIPHIASSILAATLMVFLFCFLSLPIVLALGQGSFSTLEVRIWTVFRGFNYVEASALVLLQSIVTISVAYAYVQSSRLTEIIPTTTASIKTVHFGSLSAEKRTAVLIYVIILVIICIGPIASVIHTAVYDPIRGEYTLRGLMNLFRVGTGGGLTPLINSLVYAGLSTLFAIAMGLPLAYARKSRTRVVPPLASVATVFPLGISSITLAYGLMTMVAIPLRLSLNPWPLIVIAQSIIGLPFTTRSLEIAFSKIDQDLIDSAEILGANVLQRFFFVELPLLTPGLIVGASFAFAMAIGEMSATLFIALPQNITLAVAIYEYLGVRKLVEASSAALVLILICFVMFIVIQRLSEASGGGRL